MRSFVARSISGSDDAPERVRLQQRGEMRLGPDKRWIPWTGVEHLEVQRVSLTWQARLPLFPLVWLNVVDSFKDGSGVLEGHLWGRVRLFRQIGRDLDIGEAMRYLAELVWAPHAILANQHLHWEKIDESVVEVATSVRDRRVAVRFRLDDSGDVVAVRAEARPRIEGKKSRKLPWGGSFLDYVEIRGVRIPKCGTVYWDLPEGRFEYWRGEIRDLELR